ncbi:DUF1697 domain-containing protein [Agromyces aerolatus]|uniref:DUF1697 domain-containing protein n=1 Tax=Agromyces sp. LY-1074 TaxID=3074080 RepID=UPI002864C1B5|nr:MULTISPECIES: DUF1697 domain-containing protein [unclassified Agromyces]MDR5700600.1 DUF1697 domain-containing protein [Agromyces sp. LY-1074]MDR5707121.1 DUF1697 domain-containing protein [Agromyces sp. LY-1358]
MIPEYYSPLTARVGGAAYARRITGYVALLRGVNVGGVTIRSAELREVFEGLGFDEVRTVLASGNVTFEASADDDAKLKRRIEAALGERFGYEAWIVLITRDALERVVEAFPFDEHDAGRQPYVVFASDAGVVDELVDAAAGFDADADPIAAGDAVLYWNPVKGTTLHTPFGKLLGKPRFAPTTTNRNLRTLRKVLA